MLDRPLHSFRITLGDDTFQQLKVLAEMERRTHQEQAGFFVDQAVEDGTLHGILPPARVKKALTHKMQSEIDKLAATDLRVDGPVAESTAPLVP